MYTWLQSIKNLDGQSLFFYFNWFVYMVAIVVTTIHAYGRLDYVRSYEKGQKYKTEENREYHQ